MLKGIDPVLGPDLLRVLAAMGHGDEIVIADANFPAEANAPRLVRLDGVNATRAAEAILSVLPLDEYVEAPAAVMAVVGDPDAELPIVDEFRRIAEAAHRAPVRIEQVERFAFYERARRAFAIVATGERRPYGNLILAKGVL
ncbi:MAG: ribose ABC transporter [Chloroflexota bacterium]|nr:ribose ABC transporter [Chloroflexota bacterium]